MTKFFGHKVRGLLAEDPRPNLIDYVNGFMLQWHRLHKAGKLAKQKLIFSQAGMKQLYVRHAEAHQFSERDIGIGLVTNCGVIISSKVCWALYCFASVV